MSLLILLTNVFITEVDEGSQQDQDQQSASIKRPEEQHIDQPEKVGDPKGDRPPGFRLSVGLGVETRKAGLEAADETTHGGGGRQRLAVGVFLFVERSGDRKSYLM